MKSSHLPAPPDVLGAASRRGRTRVVMLVVGVALALAALAGPALAAPDPATVTDKLMCLCGCNSVLTVCPHSDCGWGIPAKQDIAGRLEAGEDSAAIVDAYVKEYGDQVLAAPTKGGFNTVVWVLPFVVLAIGGIAVYYIARSWAIHRASPQAAVGVPVETEVPDEMQRRLDDELRKFD